MIMHSSTQIRQLCKVQLKSDVYAKFNPIQMIMHSSTQIRWLCKVQPKFCYICPILLPAWKS